MYFTPVIVLIFLNILFKQDPLRYFDVATAVLSLLLGFFLGWRCFADYGNIRAFLFSRPWSPERLFLVRWIFGLGVIAATGLVIALVLILGMREGIQWGVFENGWFPMVRWIELRVLMCFAISSLLGYNTTVYFVLSNRFFGPQRLRGFALARRRFASVLLVLIAAAAILGIVILIGMDFYSEIGYPLFIIPHLLLIFGFPALLQTLLMPCFGIHCYKNQEIES